MKPLQECLAMMIRLGRQIDEYENIDPIEFSQLNIIGVIRDFHFESLHSEIRPLFLEVYRGDPVNLFFRIRPGSAQNVIAELERQWAEFAPEMPLDYRFVDDIFNLYYEREIKVQKLFQWFTFIAIFIASMGLFALSTFAAEQRTREIGIRKVLGASEPSVVFLLTPGIPAAGRDRQPGGMAVVMVADESMAGFVCLPDRIRGQHFVHRGCFLSADRGDDGQLSRRSVRHRTNPVRALRYE